MFEDKGRIWSHNQKGVNPRPIPAKKCTMEIDFQSEELDFIQNNSIEKPAIDVIRKLNQGNELKDKQAFSLFAWTELHLIRNQKFRKQTDINYKEDYDFLLEAERKFSLYYKHISIYRCNNNEYFITSDNPILELCFNNIMIRVFVISPQVLVMMSPREGFPSTEISFVEMINSSIYANRYKYVFSHKTSLPLEIYEANENKYNLAGKMKKQHLKLTNNN